MTELTKKELMDAINYGHHWHMERIKGELEKIIASSSNNYLEICWDAEDKFYYLYDLECYLFVEHGLVSARSDRDNVFSTDMTVKYPVNSVDDIKNAFERFISMTMEDVDDDE